MYCHASLNIMPACTNLTLRKKPTPFLLLVCTLVLLNLHFLKKLTVSLLTC